MTFTRIPFAALALAVAAPAQAGLLDSCTLSLSTAGTLKMSTTGTFMSSQETGGGAAALVIVAVGIKPKLTFTAPSVVGPTGWVGSPVTYMAYTTLSGASQGYTSGGSTVQLSQLLDTVSIDARVVNTQGFKTGDYTVTSTVTCQQ